MASITSGEMADCDWLRSTFSGPLFSQTNTYILNYLNKTAKPIENLKIII
jgi:hypothetical protein